MKPNAEVYCPKCRYFPVSGDLWSCEAACGHTWNTFDTHGVCPACGKHWEDTCCPKCHGWSPHSAWYHEPAECHAESAEIALTA